MTKGGKVGMREDNSYRQGKSGTRTTVKSAGPSGSPPSMGGNPTKSGGINRATKGKM